MAAGFGLNKARDYMRDHPRLRSGVRRILLLTDSRHLVEDLQMPPKYPIDLFKSLLVTISEMSKDGLKIIVQWIPSHVGLACMLVGT